MRDDGLEKDLIVEANFSDLVGQTLDVISCLEKGSDSVLFATSTGGFYKMFHAQDCCEKVWIESVVGDVNDLIGTPILMAEETTSRSEPEYAGYSDDSYTWTFYKLATIKGYVDIRWLGESNGFYSESVDFITV